MTDRIQCCVIGCRRTKQRREFDEWICGDHWRALPKAMRRVYGRRMRQWRRYHRDEDVAPTNRLWARLKRAAIDRAMGL